MYRTILYCLLIFLTSCKVGIEKQPVDYELYKDEYNGYKARYIEIAPPNIKFTNDQQIDYFEFLPKDLLKTPQYTYPHKDSIYGTLPNKNRNYGGYVYKNYKEWVVIKLSTFGVDYRIHNIDYNNKDSTCIIRRSPRRYSFLKREDIKVAARFYEPKLIEELKIKDSLGELIINNPNGSRFYSYPHKDSIFPEYQYDRLNNQPTKILPLYASQYLYQPADHKDWLVFKNSFQFRSYDSINDYQTNYRMKYGYVFTPKIDYVQRKDARIQKSLLTEVVQFSRIYDYNNNPNDDYNSFFASKPIKIDSLLDITFTTKQEFDSYKKQNTFITYDSKIKKTGDTLTLPIKNAPYKKVYKSFKGEYDIEYDYYGEIPFLNSYLIENQDVDYIQWILVNKITGKELIMQSSPSISPNRAIIIALRPNSYDETTFMEVCQIVNGKVEILYNFEFPHWNINYSPDIRWVNNNTLIIEAASPVPVNAVYNNEKEKIEYLKIKIKNLVFN